VNSLARAVWPAVCHRGGLHVLQLVIRGLLWGLLTLMILSPAGSTDTGRLKPVSGALAMAPLA